MSLADELSRLDELRQRGVLSDEEFARAKARLLDGPAAAPAVDAVNRLRRSRADRWLGGVCGGLARATGVESWIWRLVTLGLAFFGGTGVLLYLLLWIFVPEDPV
ncbi:PspC domain-containing protein [Rubrivivax gelatinosus]|uniref:PspC domain protein n=1 Tax=Rubrivivax gelatinosus (strain NBRC 100245 / IL144) TaxID=983917 RepID=I0HSX5_RUBGI|nr:PspC domain-containing protein [Rubrivivax gelatinosus]BAL96112.1 PspC domain protein [Rubrivivax gelatinosus IL144]